MSEKKSFARFNEQMRMVILEKIDFEHPVSALTSELFEISVHWRLRCNELHHKYFG